MISTAPYSLKALITSGLLLLTLVANSQEDSLRVVDLQSVTVNALALPSDNFAFPGMVGRIDQTSLANTDPTIITPALNKIPGVYMHSGALNTNRITVRGIGSRTPFATNKIRAFYGEIPLTDGGGETTIEDIDLSLIQNVEVQKGPSSSSYGAGLGGVILLRPQQPSKSSLTLNAGAGSFGLRRYGGLLQHTQNGKSLIMGFQTQHADGYRDNNTLDRSNYFLGYTQTGKRSDTHIMVLHTRQKAFIPSALNEEDYRNEPTKAAFTWGQAKGFEDYDKTLLGIYRDRRLSENLQLKYALYLNHRDNYEPRPFNILDDQVIGGGGRWRVIWETHNFTLQSGLELYRDTYEWQTYENLYESFDRGSVQGDLLSDNKEIRYYQNYFVQSRWQIMEQTTLEAGVNINQTGYRFNTTARNEESTKFDLIPCSKPGTST